MSETIPTWNLTDQEWAAIIEFARSNSDVLEDGALARVNVILETGTSEVNFFATALNKPQGWQYPFLEPIPKSDHLGAFIGRAWHEPSTGFVEFEIVIIAAAQALRADYESGVDDLDYTAYEQAVDRAVQGTLADAEWLYIEFGRLVRIAKQN